MGVPLRITSVLILLAGFGSAQEPAFYRGAQAVRFPEAPGFYHYVLPCKPPGLNGPSVQSAATEPAICWPVRVIRTQIVQGKPETSPPVDGTIAISASAVQFLADKPADASYNTTFPSGLTQFQHQAGKPVGVIGTRDLAFVFGLSNTCVGCSAASTSAPPPDASKLDAEFAKISEALRDFSAANTWLNSIASQLRVGVTPHNQPSPTDGRNAQALYSELNRSLAPLCSEPAKSCVLRYATFQQCKSADTAANCGDAPACSAFCAISRDELKTLRATVCESKLEDSATLSPDWASFFEGLQRSATSHTLAPEFKPVSPADATASGCTAASLYAQSDMMFGLEHATSHGNGGEPIFITPGLLGPPVKRVPPVYPPVARSARIEGTVVLRVHVAKDGTVQSVVPVSGPALLVPAAMEAVKQWQFRIGPFTGPPYEYQTSVAVNFHLTTAASDETTPDGSPPKP